MKMIVKVGICNAIIFARAIALRFSTILKIMVIRLGLSLVRWVGWLPAGVVRLLFPFDNFSLLKSIVTKFNV